MAEYPAFALASCRDCWRQETVAGVVGVSGGTPDAPGEAEFYPDLEGTLFEDCPHCWSPLHLGAGPNLDIDDVGRKEPEDGLATDETGDGGEG